MNLSIITFLTAILLSSCSGTYQAYYQTIQLAFSHEVEASMSFKATLESKVDLLSVKRGDRASIIMALAFIEDNQHKWISADKAMLIEEKGRLVRTLGLEENLLYLSNTEIDPLKKIEHSINKNWVRVADWTGDEYGYQIQSEFIKTEKDNLAVFNREIETIKYTERVNYTQPTEFVRTNQSWENVFWFDKANGTLLKSIQTLAPNIETIEMVYLSRISRLIGSE